MTAIDVAKPIDRLLEALADHECEPKRTSQDHWRAKCPVHDDHDPSLSITNDGALLVYCHAGCNIIDVLKALGLSKRDLFQDNGRPVKGRKARASPSASDNGKVHPSFEAAIQAMERTLKSGHTSARFDRHYDYYDESGAIAFRVARFRIEDKDGVSDKTFRQARPTVGGGWIWNLKGVVPVLYRLPNLTNADADRPVYIVEGEKDADRMADLGLLVTCSPMGAGKWSRVDDAPLHGRHVRIIPDNDRPGREHARDVARRLHGKAITVRIVELPDLPEHGDACAYLDNGGTIEALVKLADEAPEYESSDNEPEAREDRRDYHLTDLGNAERFADQHRGAVRYCHPWGKWLVWDGRRWGIDDTGRIKALAKRTVRSIYREAAATDDDDRRKALVKYARASEADPKIRAMLSLAPSEPGIPVRPEDLDRDPMKLTCRNGTIDLEMGELRPHDANDLIARLADVEFDPDAESDLWYRFVEEATDGDPELAAFLQRAVGYSLTGSTVEEKLFFVHGPAASGKTTFVEAVKAAMGEYATTADFETFIERKYVGGPRADIARLAGARLVASVEVSDGRRLAHGLVKMLTGGDTVAARHLYQNAFEFVPAFKLWLAANAAPNVSDDDDAMWRRILRVPFERVIPKDKQDAQVKATLKTDPAARAAVLRWAVDGCLAWQMEGLRVPESVETATEEYRLDQDPLKEFLADCCTFGRTCWVETKLLREAYEQYAKETGIKRTLSPRGFADRLKARGCRSEKRYDRRGWSGIGVLCEGRQTDQTDQTDVPESPL